MAEASESDAHISWLEWVVGACGALALLGILGVILTNALSSAGEPPSISVKVESVDPVPTGFVVTFTARNDGELTAAGVKLQAVLGPGEIETREVTLDFLPPHSIKRGGFIFQHDPRDGELVIEAHGYLDP